MPEYKEIQTTAHQLKEFINKTPPAERTLVNIWVDSTCEEAAAAPSDSRASQGHVHVLDSSSQQLRGQNKSQTVIYPPLFASSGSVDVPISAFNLVLSKTLPSPRNIFLCFLHGLSSLTTSNPDDVADTVTTSPSRSDIFKLGKLAAQKTWTIDDLKEEYWSQIQPLKHTSAQIFTREEWYNAICLVPKTIRGFKVGIAFEFPKHVAAFLSLDLLIQLHWSPSQTLLPGAQQADICSNYELFLQQLVAWMTKRKSSRAKLDGLAIMRIREDTSIFSGGGLYTMDEVFHKAGLTINITEAELFGNPSRTARLVAAYYDFAFSAREETSDFLKPHMRGFLLACHRTNRIQYSKELMVYGKDRVNCTKRFKSLLIEYKDTLSSHQDNTSEGAAIWECWFGQTGTPYDVFEPDYISHALKHTDIILGSLIFGVDLWESLSSSISPEVYASRSKSNPLVEYFSSPKYEKIPTTLNLDHYTTLFSRATPSRGMTAWTESLLYKRGSTGDLWTALPIYPDNSKPLGSKKASSSVLSLLDRAQKKANLLSNVTQHSEVYTVGPLDYCGVAQIIYGPGGKEIQLVSIMVCKHDPRHSLLYQEQHLVSAETAKLKGKGGEKEGLEPAQKKAIKKKLALASIAHSSSSPFPDISSSPAPSSPTPILSSLSSSSSKRKLSSTSLDDQVNIPSKPKRAYKKQRRSADRDLAM